MHDLDNVIDFNVKKKAPVVGVIIQARMTSARFPGKSMAILQGKPVIEHVIRNCQLIRPVHKVILAVPDTEDSEPMLALASSLGVENFCGSEHDVLNRYVEAARLYNLDVIMRITGDCPFIMPTVCSEVLQLLLWRKLDYASNICPIRTYPKGMDCEVFTRDCLDACYVLAENDIEPAKLVSYNHEHVTPWMQDNKQLKKVNVVQKENASHINLCVDTPEDLVRLEIYRCVVTKNDN